ncbi:MAG: hypothetical protein ACREOC_03270 [Gemmatimonadales bacterium]
MSLSRSIRAIGVLLPFSTAGAPAQESPARPVLADVRVVASDTLQDVAVTRFERGRPTIYYNPTLLAHVGPRLTRFFFAHEYAHVARGHAGGALGPADPAFSLGRRARELDADCDAAEHLAATDPEDVEAAIRFFTLAGDFRFDDLHPRGTERANRIAFCAGIAPPAAPAPDLITTVTWSAPAAAAGDYGEARIWMDQVPVGTLSNFRAVTGALRLRGFPAGVHTYVVVLESWHLDGALQLTPGGTVEGTGTVEAAPGDTLVVGWMPGGPPSLRQAAEPPAGSRQPHATIPRIFP